MSEERNDRKDAAAEIVRVLEEYGLAAKVEGLSQEDEQTIRKAVRLFRRHAELPMDESILCGARPNTIRLETPEGLEVLTLGQFAPERAGETLGPWAAWLVMADWINNLPERPPGDIVVIDEEVNVVFRTHEKQDPPVIVMDFKQIAIYGRVVVEGEKAAHYTKKFISAFRHNISLGAGAGN